MDENELMNLKKQKWIQDFDALINEMGIHFSFYEALGLIENIKLQIMMDDFLQNQNNDLI